MAKYGHVSIYRDIFGHWTWEDKPFCKGAAWIDLLLLASYRDKKCVLGNEIIELERGSFITSELKLMDRWGWSKSKVRNFLKILEKDKMIYKKSDTKKTTLTIVNYSHYQYSKTTEELPEDYEKTAKELRKDTINKENKENKVNKKINKDIAHSHEPLISDEEDYKKNPIETHFEKIWKLYPMKKGKGKITLSKKKELYKLGDEIERCIGRYTDHVEGERRKGFTELRYQDGSRFFTTGYIDFLDENFQEFKSNENTNKIEKMGEI